MPKSWIPLSYAGLMCGHGSLYWPALATLTISYSQLKEIAPLDQAAEACVLGAEDPAFCPMLISPPCCLEMCSLEVWDSNQTLCHGLISTSEGDNTQSSWPVFPSTSDAPTLLLTSAMMREGSICSLIWNDPALVAT